MSEKPPPPSGERLAKVIARAGLCSRRDAEDWITAGRVAVNGSEVKTPAFNVNESDVIAVDGKTIARREATALWLYHKPAGLMVTEKDPEGRPTVFEAFEALGLPRVLTVGRLDYNTEGLLLLTNDGGLKRTLELPATGWARRYRVRAFGSVTQAQLDGLREGVTAEGVSYGPIEATLDSAKGSNVWITMSLREGKNREVRNVLGALGLEVNRLIRLSYGPFQLGDLPEGAIEKVKPRILRDQLGKRLAEQAGADFSAPEPGARDDGPPPPRRLQPEKPESRATERDRHGGLRKRPEGRARPEPRPVQERTLHFDDGRPSQSFVPSTEREAARRSDRDERPARDGDRPQRREGKPFEKRADNRPARKPFRDSGKPGSRPARASFDRSADRPAGERSRGETSGKPGGERPRGGKPGGKPFGAKPGGKFPGKPGGQDRKPGGRPQGRPGGRPGAKPAGDRRGPRPPKGR